MPFTQLFPLLAVVGFWIAAFLFAFWFSTRALLAPTEGELEETGLETTAVEANDQVPSTQSH
jgi:hypothetical protein